MSAALRMWLLLRRRTVRDGQWITQVLAVLAFAVCTAVLLIVIGGYTAFDARAAGDEYGEVYTVLAAIATIMLTVPLVTLGGAAARLAIARRDARLAAMRLAGATTSQVGLLTVLDASVQAVTGAVLGVLGSFALVPIVQLVEFQGQPFTYAELLAPGWVYPTVILGVALIGVMSAGASLRQLAITPLGVAQRHGVRALHWSRLLPLVAVGVVFGVMAKGQDPELMVMAVMLGLGMLVLNVVGPLVMSVIGRISVHTAKDAASVVAARRLADQPKTAWRSVGGVGLASFIAGIAAITALIDGEGAQAQLAADTATGGVLTLVIAGIVAAVSTGVMQAGRIIDQGPQYRALHLAGASQKVLQRARRRETSVPLVATVALATGAALTFILPIFGVAGIQHIGVVLQYGVSVAVACALVMAGSWLSGRLIPSVSAAA